LEDKAKPQPPPAEGVRLAWQDVPEQVRAAVEDWLGSKVVSAASQATGFSPGVAARLRTATDRRVFVKAVGPKPNPDVPDIHRREARITALLPLSAPVPRLLWSYDDPETDWVALIFEDVEGRHPAQPWRKDELNHVLEALVTLGDVLTPSPLPPGTVSTASEEFSSRLCGWRQLKDEQPTYVSGLDDWSIRHLGSLARIESTAGAAVEGNTLLNFDVRADNILLTRDRVWFVDWPLACVGAAWVDVLFFAPSVHMQGGPPPEQVIMRHPACRAADADAITAAVVATAGFFTLRSLQPPPPGLPTVRAFQAAQGVVAREWIAHRTGWE